MQGAPDHDKRRKNYQGPALCVLLFIPIKTEELLLICPSKRRSQVILSYYTPFSSIKPSCKQNCKSLELKSRLSVVERIGPPVFSDLTIAYLFLGGMGSGALILLSLCGLAANLCANHPHPGQKSARAASVCMIPNKFYSLCYTASAFVLILGCFCLAFDLPDPSRSYLLFLNPHFNAMSVGAFSLGFSALFAIVLACVYGFDNLRLKKPLLITLLALTVLAATVTAVYPGILMMSMPPDAAWHSWLVPLLFTLSALSTGIGLIWLCHAPHPELRAARVFCVMLTTLDTWLIAGKVLFTVLYLIIAATVLGGSQEVAMLLNGSQSYIFWAGYFACGLALPVILERSLYRRPSAYLFVLISCLLLVGGLCLRIAVVLLGS